MSVTIDQIQAVANLIPHIEDRFPHTYHHDWVRTHIPAYYSYSRSDVAALGYDDYELYALALLEIIQEANPCELILLELGKEDRDVIRECITFARGGGNVMQRQEFEEHQWRIGDKIIVHTSFHRNTEVEVLGVDFETYCVKIKGWAGRRVWIFCGDAELKK